MLGAGGGSSGGVINLGFQVYLQDNFSGPAAGIKTTLDGLKNEANMHVENLSALRNITAAVGGAALLISKGIYDAAMEGAEFLHTMQGVLAISEATADEFTRLKSLAITLGRETIFTPDEVASGMRFMAMAGQTAAQIQATAQDSTYLAAATLTHLGGKMGAADILTNALKAFGLEVENSTEMSDMLTYATTNANVTLTDLGNSIRYVAATSRNLNIPVQETFGLLMSLGNAGIQASMAGTALENMYRYLAMSVSEFATVRQKKTWENIGLSRADVMTATGQFKPMVEVLGLIKQATEGMGAVDVQNVMKEIFGVRGQRGAATIMRNLEMSQSFIDQLQSGSIRGTAAEKSALMMESLKGASLKLTSALEGLHAAFAEALGETFLNDLLVGLSKLVGMLQRAIQTPVGKWIFSIGTILTAFTGIVLVTKAAIWSLALAFSTLRVSIAGMVAAGTVGTDALLGRGAIVAGAGGLRGGEAGSGLFLANKQRSKLGVPAGADVRYSAKRGMMYHVAKDTGHTTWIAKSKAASAVGKGGMLAAGRMAGLGRAVGGILSWLAGPGMILILLTVTVLPMLISGISSLIGSTDKNTEALKMNNEFDPQLVELFSQLGQMKWADIVKAINEGLKRKYDEGMPWEELQALRKNSENTTELLKLIYYNGYGMVPTTAPSDGKNKP